MTMDRGEESVSHLASNFASGFFYGLYATSKLAEDRQTDKTQN